MAHFSPVNRRLICQFYNWFKYHGSKKIYHNAKNRISATRSSRYRIGHVNIKHILSHSIRFDEPVSRLQWNHNHFIGLHGRLHFFIQQYVTSRERTQTQRLNHFQRLVNEVFTRWVGLTAELSENRDGCHHSFMKLYINIVDDLKQPVRVGQVEKHLTHNDYDETKKLLDSIESKSSSRNSKVDSFMESVDQNILQNVFSEKIFSGIGSLMEPYHDPNIIHGYSMFHILKHNANETHGSHAMLRVDPYEIGKFKLHREDDNSNFIAISTNNEMLAAISKALQGQLQTDIVKTLKELLTDGQRICDSYNNKFKDEINNIISEFEDEGSLKGACGLSYCK
jgi:hypothetical protein